MKFHVTRMLLGIAAAAAIPQWASAGVSLPGGPTIEAGIGGYNPHDAHHWPYSDRPHRQADHRRDHRWYAEPLYYRPTPVYGYRPVAVEYYPYRFHAKLPTYYISRPGGDLHVHYHHDRHGRPVPGYSWH